MPHFILEYSANIKDELNLDGLFKALHETAMETGVFPLGGIRFRALRCDDYLIADADPENAFIHMSAKIGHGRAIEVRKAAGEKMFNALVEQLADLYDRRPLAVSFELSELTPGLSFKKNNIHEKIKAEQKGHSNV